LKLPSGKQQAPAELSRVFSIALSSRDPEQVSALGWQMLLAHKSDKRREFKE